jgi:hypothetical protein
MWSSYHGFPPVVSFQVYSLFCTLIYREFSRHVPFSSISCYYLAHPRTNKTGGDEVAYSHGQRVHMLLWKFVLNIRHKAKLTLHVLVQVAFLVALCCPFISSFVVLLLVIILFFPVVHKFDWGIEESEVEIFLARSWFWTRLRYFWGALARLQS